LSSLYFIAILFVRSIIIIYSPAHYQILCLQSIPIICKVSQSIKICAYSKNIVTIEKWKRKWRVINGNCLKI